MADFIEKYGDSIDDAVELALRDLKLTREQVEITVIEEPSNGFLGLFGKKLAKVRVEKKPEPEKKKVFEKKVNEVKEVIKNKPERTERPEKAAKPERTEKREAKPAKAEKKPQTVEELLDNASEGDNKKRKPHGSRRMHTKFTITAEDTDAVAADSEPGIVFIREMIKNMNLDVNVKGNIKDDILYVSLEGKEVGTLIGKRGQTLDSVQYLASIVQNKNADNHLRVIVNAESYREKREKTLVTLSKRLADKCVRNGKSVRLEPMSPYERKVIHSTLQSHPKVTTRSEGTEPNRRVVIELKK